MLQPHLFLDVEVIGHGVGDGGHGEGVLEVTDGDLGGGQTTRVQDGQMAFGLTTPKLIGPKDKETKYISF